MYIKNSKRIFRKFKRQTEFIFLCNYLFIFIFFCLINDSIHYYNANEEELYKVILNIKRNNEIKKTSSNIEINYTLKCADISRVLINNTFKVITFFKENKIKYGIKSIRKNNRIIITKSINKTVHESYNIYFMKYIYVNQYGSIITSSNQYISIKGGCRCNEEINEYIDIEKINKRYDLVLQITQYLGRAIYHSIINVLTKIVPLLYTLKHLQNSKIHIHNNTAIFNYLKILNIDRGRLIYGNIFSENVIIMGRVECTSSIYTNSIIELRNLLLKNINKKYNFKDDNIKTFLFIKRLYTRRINNFEEIMSSICKAYTNYKCKTYYPNTEFKIMVNLFSNADIIIGPHGAGFTNVIISKNNVMIYEILKENHPVLCFATLSNILGYKYYGLYSKCNSREEFNLNITILLKSFKEQFLL